MAAIANSTRQAKVETFRFQSRACATLGSPLYGILLDRAAQDVEDGGPVWDAVARDDRPGPDMLALRLMGAAHRLVLEGRAPDLARHYPSAGGDGDAEAAWPAFRELVAEQSDAVAELIERPVQTNEVGRAAMLLGGFLLVARDTGLPLRLRELGACAGLVSRWDGYRYSLGASEWGDPQSPVHLTAQLLGAPPPLDGHPEIVERRALDRAPVDATTEDGVLTLLSYVWPDQGARFTRLRAALDLAPQRPVAVERAGAADWLETGVLEPQDGTATVVFHSIMWQYLDDAERERALAVLEREGARATARAPLAWLRMESGMGTKKGRLTMRAEVRLTTWPGGDERLLATAHYHGDDLDWLAA